MAEIPAHIAEQLTEFSQVVFQTAAKNLTLMLNTDVTAGAATMAQHDDLSGIIGGENEPFGADTAKTFVFSKLSLADDMDLVFTLTTSDALYLSNTMLGNNEPGDGKLDELQVSALGEIFSQFLNASAPGIGNLTGNDGASFSAPVVSNFGEDGIRENVPQLLALSINTITCDLQVDGGNTVTLHLWMSDDEGAQFATAAKMHADANGGSAASNDDTPTDAGDASSVNVSEDALAAAFADLSEPDGAGQPPVQQQVTVQPVDFASFDNQPAVNGEHNKNLDLLMDVKMALSVRLGDAELPLKQVLELTRGSVVELNRLAGEAVDLYANGKLIARGEVVVIEDNFGLRITSIVSPQERLRELAAI